MRVAVAGGTGRVGRHTVTAARAAGHDVVAISRSLGVDILTGAGLDGALDGVDAVIDVTSTAALSARAARSFFEAGTRRLLAAEAAAGVGHHVTLSVVGIDGIDSSHYAGKLAQERVVAAGDVPYTIARATQFHEFVGMMLAFTKGPLALVPHMLVRPVAAREVGEHLVRVAEREAAGRARDLVGPRDEELADLARREIAFDGLRRRVLGMRLPGSYGSGIASGVLRGKSDAEQGTVTFDEWLRDGRR